MRTKNPGVMQSQSLYEKIYIKINGIQQGMFLESEDTDKPVLLFLHGGPGSPEIAFTQQYPTGLEQLFTVCWWEQRNCGISYHRNTPKDTMTIEQMIADTIAVTNYLRQRFSKEKVYVLGHSWGSVLGVLTVQQAPELFHAYIGMGQVVCQLESERLAYTYMLKEFCAVGNKKMVRKLKRYPIDQGAEVSKRYLAVRSEGMMKLGIGIMHRNTSMLEPVLVVLRYRGYTWIEKVNFARGSLFGLKCLWDFVMQTDFIRQVPQLEVPVYVLQGRFDYQVSYAIAKEYVRIMKAPVKGFYTFEDSAHSPCFEEPEKMIRILQEDVLQGKADLADSLE